MKRIKNFRNFFGFALTGVPFFLLNAYGQNTSFTENIRPDTNIQTSLTAHGTPGFTWDDAVIQCLNSKVRPTVLIQTNPFLASKGIGYRQLVNDIRTGTLLEPVIEELKQNFASPRDFLKQDSAFSFYQAWSKTLRDAHTEQERIINQATDPKTSLAQWTELKSAIARQQVKNWLFLSTKDLTDLTDAYSMASKEIHERNQKILLHAKVMAASLTTLPRQPISGSNTVSTPRSGLRYAVAGAGLSPNKRTPSR